MLLACGAFFLSIGQAPPEPPQPTVALASPVDSPPPLPAVTYEMRSLPNGIAHVVTVPPEGHYRVVPAVSDTVATVEAFAERALGATGNPMGSAENAIAVLNAGFFDPVNQKSTSFVTIDGTLVADPGQNERLMENSRLAPYLDKILNRTEFRRYQCQQEVSGMMQNRDRYEITLHSSPTPAGCQLVDALGGGPQLLPELTAEVEGFLEVVDGQVLRDSIGIYQENARSAVGLTSDGSIVWVMVAQRANATGDGVSLPGLAELMRSLSVIRAMNLDGGSSSALYYRGQPIYGKYDESGQAVRRPVKSVLLLQHRGAPG